MSHENVEIVRQVYESFNRRDWDSTADLFDPNVEQHGTVGGIEEGEGTLVPSPDAALLHGCVIWRITQGRGRFEGARGFITSNFLLSPTTGNVDEQQVAVVFLP